MLAGDLHGDGAAQRMADEMRAGDTELASMNSKTTVIGKARDDGSASRFHRLAMARKIERIDGGTSRPERRC